MKLSNTKIQLFIYPIVAVLLLFTVACEENTTEPEDVPAIDFRMETVSGDTLQLSDTLGKIVILQFMNWDCPPCQAEVPVLNQIYDNYSRDEVVVWAISFPHSADDVVGAQTLLKENFVDPFGAKYPILIDNRLYTSLYVFEAYSVQGTPTTVIIGKEGYIQFHYGGGTVPLDSFEEWIQVLK
ncbi:MAG: redoxin domain-containing protein [Candidatus Marinimicrobia bacterium]|nr:redoxin domain-containing protein [Candidatus Neomarinimicrobiota bacterium]